MTIAPGSQEPRLGCVLATITEGVWIVDAEGRTAYASGALEGLLRAEAGALAGLTIEDLVAPDHRAALAALLADARRGEGRREIAFVRADGSPLVATVSARPLGGEGAGGERQTLLALLDVTETRRFEAEHVKRLAELQALFHLRDALQAAASFDQMAEAAFDAMTSVLGVDRASVQIFDDRGATRFVARRGLTDQYVRIVEQHWRSTFDPASPRIFVSSDIAADAERESLWREILQEGIRSLVSVPLIAQRRLIGKFVVYHGDPRQFGQEQLNLAGTIANNVAFAVDRKRSEEALRESAARLKLALSASATGTWAWDLASGDVLWDEHTCAIFGVDPARFPGSYRAFVERVHPDDRERVERASSDSVARDDELCITFRALRPDGTARHVSCRGRCLHDEFGRPRRMTGVIQDVTDRVLAEDERDRLLERMRETQRLESLGLLAGGIAHDFNNLLVGVLGNVAAVKRAVPRGTPADRALQTIETAAERAAALAQQMLAYSGRGRFDVRELDLGVLVAEMTELLRATVSRSAELACEPTPDLPSVRADATQMRQLVMNLITNAADALEGRGGRIRVRTGSRLLDAAAIERLAPAQGLEAGDFVFVEVADDGCGMDAETMSKVFDPFFTTKFHGRGLGLAAALGIVRGHGGAIVVESQAGRGTTFTVLLPAAAAAEAPPAPAPTEGPEAAADGWRGRGQVLVVDDEPIVRLAVGRVLDSVGFGVVEAADGEEAVRTFRENGERIVAVLLDMTMPGMAGPEVLRALRRLRADVPVVLFSGYSEVDVEKRLSDAGPALFLAKPFREEELVEKMRAAMGGR